MAVLDLTRTQKRQHLTVDYRVERLEEDADVAEAHDDLLLAKLDKLTARLTGLLLSLVVASLMLAANLAFLRPG